MRRARWPVGWKMTTVRASIPSAQQRGFTLLELQVAVLLLTILVFGFQQLAKSHESMLGDLESWCHGEPVFQIVSPEDPHERAAGVPAALRESDETDDFLTTSATEETYAQRILIERIERDLDPARVTAWVLVDVEEEAAK